MEDIKSRNREIRKILVAEFGTVNVGIIAGTGRWRDFCHITILIPDPCVRAHCHVCMPKNAGLCIETNRTISARRMAYLTISETAEKLIEGKIDKDDYHIQVMTIE